MVGRKLPRRREKLVLANLGLAHTLARIWGRRVPRHVEFEDLESAAHEGLVKAALGFDPAHGYPFDQYARARIDGEIRDHLRALTPAGVPRGENPEAPLSLDTEVIDEGGSRQALVETLVDSAEPGFEPVLAREVVAEVLEQLPERERAAVVLHDLEDLPLKEIGDLLDVGEARVSQLRKAGLGRLRRLGRSWLDAA